MQRSTTVNTDKEVTSSVPDITVYHIRRPGTNFLAGIAGHDGVAHFPEGNTKTSESGGFRASKCRAFGVGGLKGCRRKKCSKVNAGALKARSGTGASINHHRVTTRVMPGEIKDISMQSARKSSAENVRPPLQRLKHNQMVSWSRP